MNAYILESSSCRFSIAHHDAFLLCVGTGALIALKKAHRYADEQKKMQATILNLENQKMSIESAAFNVEIMQTYETSSKTLKNIHKDMYVVFILTGMQDDSFFVVDSNCVISRICFSIYSDTDKVDDIMEEMEEQHDISNQISEALTRNADDIFEDVSYLVKDFAVKNILFM